MKKEPKAEIFMNGVVMRGKNLRIILKKDERHGGGVLLEMFSVNNNKSNEASHVLTTKRMGRRSTAVALSFEAINAITAAAILYHKHIEPITVESWLYNSDLKPNQ